MWPSLGGSQEGVVPSPAPSQQAYIGPRQIESGCETSPLFAQSEQGESGQRRIDDGRGMLPFPTPLQQGHRGQLQLEGGDGISSFPGHSQQGHRGQFQLEGGDGVSPFPTHIQQGHGRQLQFENGYGPESSSHARMRNQQDEQAFGPGDQENQHMPYGHLQTASFMRSTQSFNVAQSRGIPSHHQDRFSRTDDSFGQHSQQRHQPSHVSEPLNDIRLTTMSYHYEPRPKPYMREKDFALAIATDYVTAWSKFTQASITRHFRAIGINILDPAIIKPQHIQWKRKYLEQMLPRQLEEMKCQISEGDDLQVRHLVEWIRKEKIWEREHGWDLGPWALPALGDYRHLLPWMQGAKVNKDLPQGSSNQSAGAGLDDLGDHGSWEWGDLR